MSGRTGELVHLFPGAEQDTETDEVPADLPWRFRAELLGCENWRALLTARLFRELIEASPELLTDVCRVLAGHAERVT